MVASPCTARSSILEPKISPERSRERPRHQPEFYRSAPPPTSSRCRGAPLTQTRRRPRPPSRLRLRTAYLPREEMERKRLARGQTPPRCTVASTEESERGTDVPRAALHPVEKRDGARWFSFASGTLKTFSPINSSIVSLSFLLADGVNRFSSCAWVR